MSFRSIPDKWLENITDSGIKPYLNICLKEKLEIEHQKRDAPFWIVRHDNRYLTIVVKNPSFDENIENSIEYFVLYEFHEKDCFPGEILWKLCTVHAGASAPRSPEEFLPGTTGASRTQVSRNILSSVRSSFRRTDLLSIEGRWLTSMNSPIILELKSALAQTEGYSLNWLKNIWIV